MNCSIDIQDGNRWVNKTSILPSHVSAVKHDERNMQALPIPIVKTTLIKNTKKHLSASNHFPANSRLFNRSLQELQSQADAISSAYLTNPAKKFRQPRISSGSLKESYFRKIQVGKLIKTTDITSCFKDVNENRIKVDNNNNAVLDKYSVMKILVKILLKILTIFTPLSKMS